MEMSTADWTGKDLARLVGSCTLPGYEPEAGAFDEDEAKDYAAETINRHLDYFRARLSKMLKVHRIKVVDEFYGLEHADLLLDLDDWLTVRDRQHNRANAFGLSDLSMRAGCGEAECYGQYPTVNSPKLLYGYRFSWSPFSQRGAQTQPRDAYPEFPIVQEGHFLTREKYENLYSADPKSLFARQVMRAVARYNAATAREP